MWEGSAIFGRGVPYLGRGCGRYAAVDGDDLEEVKLEEDRVAEHRGVHGREAHVVRDGEGAEDLAEPTADERHMEVLTWGHVECHVGSRGGRRGPGRAHR
eukprot:4813001-Prymnesium_polylepis.1